MAEIRMNLEMHEKGNKDLKAHEKIDFNILQVALNLATVCVISGLIIAITYFFTAPIAAQKNVLLEQQAMQSLVLDADHFQEVPDKTNWYAAEKKGEIVAYIVPNTTKGYGGEIDVLVAVSTQGSVIDYQLLVSNETPGLGDNASKQPFRSQFNGKISEQLVVTKDPNNTENIQALTGATITSKAVTSAVKEVEDEVVAFVGGK